MPPGRFVLLGRLSALELRFEFSVFPPQFGYLAALVDEQGGQALPSSLAFSRSNSSSVSTFCS